MLYAETFRLKRGERLTGHHHRTLHICLVRDGEFVERIRGEWRECAGGTIRVSPPGAGHEIEVPAEAATGRILELGDAVTAGLPGRLDASTFLDPDSVTGPMRRLETALDIQDTFGVETASLELAARAVAPRGKRVEAPEWLRELRAELESRPAMVLPLAGAARRYRRHRSHVARSFQHWFGRSIGSHARAHRLAEAVHRLRATEQRLPDIAAELGFTDQAHFSRAFRERYGLPPGRYRRSARAGATPVQEKPAPVR